jgi:hypothetical protein
MDLSECTILGKHGDNVMTPAEFRCAREHMGLNVNWLAHRLGTTPRTINRWESPFNTIAIPADAVKFMNDMLAAASRVVGMLTLRCKEQPGKPLIVPSYEVNDLPVNWYRMLASRVRERTGVTLVYGDDKPVAPVPQAESA